MEFEVNTVVTYKSLDGKTKIHYITNNTDFVGIFEFKTINPSKTIAIPHNYIDNAIKILDIPYDSFMISMDYSIY